MKANKKKIIVLVAMILLLVATGCLNYFLNVKSNIDKVDANTQPTFFETFRQDRVTTRQQEIVHLNEIIASEVSSAEAVAAAETQKLALTAAMETELVLEGLIKASGHTDCVVTISTKNVNVVVKDDDLTLEEATRILDIIVTQTDFKAVDVDIYPYA